jgi:(2Fe-2S) ferredoxin
MSQDPLFYRCHVFCCTNERPPDNPKGSCKAKGAGELQKYMKVRAKELGIANTRINQAGCLDRCALGCALVIYPEGVWYTYGSKADIDEILERHLLKGERVERLLLSHEQTELTEAQKQGRAPAAS